MTDDIGFNLEEGSFCAVKSTICRLMDLHEIVHLNMIYKLSSSNALHQFTYIAEVLYRPVISLNVGSEQAKSVVRIEVESVKVNK